MGGKNHRGLDSCEDWRELPYDEMRVSKGASAPTHNILKGIL